jgi:LacI family transcriptional regulator
MSKKVTMQDIADALSITKVSVSKAINNRPGISEARRQQILLMAKKMEYGMEGSKDAQAYHLAFVCPKRFFLEDDTFYTTIYYYINKQCLEQNHTVACFVINSEDELALRLPDKLQTERFDGVFIAGEFRHDYLQLLLPLQGAKVFVDFYLPELSFDCIISDNFHLGQSVTDYLIRKGHTKIGFVGDIRATSSICDRYFGYQKALKLAGISGNDAWHIVNNDSFSGQYSLKFDLPQVLPTAFVCHCDKAAFTLMQRLDMAGIKVPQDVSIISFDNTALCELTRPRLTSVDFDRRQIARLGMQAMITRIREPERPVGYLYGKGSLMERDSVSDRKEI